MIEPRELVAHSTTIPAAAGFVLWNIQAAIFPQRAGRCTNAQNTNQ